MIKKNKLSIIKYVDAYYSYARNTEQTKLVLHEACGWVAKNGNTVIVTFIKKIDGHVKNSKNKILVKGLVIPITALASHYKQAVYKIPKDIKRGTTIAVTWRDIRYVANMRIDDCSIMYTEGVLSKIEKDHIVLSKPETIRIHPTPVINHPIERPTFYVIPVSFITEISAI